MNSSSNQNASDDARIDTLKSEVNDAFKAIIQLPDDVKRQKNEDVKKMIEYYGRMTDNIENRRIRIADFAWQSLAVTLTAAGVLLALSIVAVIKIPLLLVLTTIFVMSLLKIREFQVQSYFRYPFLRFPEFGNVWKWFYYGNSFIPQINEDPYTVESTRTKDQSLYLQGLELFVGNYSKETIDREIHDNLLQLFLLQVHNYYKNRFYLRLLKYDLITPKVLFWTQVAYWVIAVLIIAKYPAGAAFLLGKAL